MLRAPRAGRRRRGRHEQARCRRSAQAVPQPRSAGVPHVRTAFPRRQTDVDAARPQCRDPAPMLRRFRAGSRSFRHARRRTETRDLTPQEVVGFRFCPSPLSVVTNRESSERNMMRGHEKAAFGRIGPAVAAVSSPGSRPPSRGPVRRRGAHASTRGMRQALALARRLGRRARRGFTDQGRAVLADAAHVSDRALQPALGQRGGEAGEADQGRHSERASTGPGGKPCGRRHPPRRAGRRRALGCEAARAAAAGEHRLPGAVLHVRPRLGPRQRDRLRPDRTRASPTSHRTAAGSGRRPTAARRSRRGR